MAIKHLIKLNGRLVFLYYFNFLTFAMFYCLSSDISKISKEYALRVLAYLGFLPLFFVFLLAVALQNVLNLI